jgi:hypothetical protein
MAIFGPVLACTGTVLPDLKNCSEPLEHSGCRSTSTEFAAKMLRQKKRRRWRR